ncbi:MAG: response regulator transcription factor [Streptosporangiales bacterium]
MPPRAVTRRWSPRNWLAPRASPALSRPWSGPGRRPPGRGRRRPNHIRWRTPFCAWPRPPRRRATGRRPAADTVRPAPEDPLARFGLTEREREILVLLAAGRSNPQIAETLFISPKTASVHVSNILAKLGVASRVEAAAVAHRLGVTG